MKLKMGQTTKDNLKTLSLIIQNEHSSYTALSRVLGTLGSPYTVGYLKALENCLSKIDELVYTGLRTRYKAEFDLEPGGSGSGLGGGGT